MSKISALLTEKYGTLMLFTPHHTCIGPIIHSKYQYPFEEGFLSDHTFYKASPFDFTIPLPLLPMKKVPKSFLYGIDPVKKLIEEKVQWKTLLKIELGSFRKSYRSSDIKVIERKLKTADSVHRIQRYVVLLAKILEFDPDDQFDGYYNWYYSGGSLNHISIQENKYLLKSRGKNRNEIEAVPLLNSQSVYLEPDLKQKVCFSIANKEPICQIVTCEEKGFVGVRQNKKCVIFSLSDKSKSLGFTKLDETNSLKPFTSIDFDKSVKDHYITMKTDSSCCIRNLGRRRTVREWEVPDCSNEHIDKWCSAFYGQNRDTIVCLNRRYIRTYDTRAKNMNCMEFCPAETSKILENCERITCAVEGSNNVDHPLIYVSTYHHLLALDLRFPRAFVQSWSHGMKHGPCYMSVSCAKNTTSQNQTEVVLLGSQITKEIHAVINDFSAKSDKAFSSVFPISIPSYKETLSLVQWHGKLLDPSIQKRFSAVNTGMCCFEEPKGGITCFHENSLGDIFQQHLLAKYTRHGVELPYVLQHISNWEKSKRNKSRKKLTTVIRTDKKKLFEKMASTTRKIIPRNCKLNQTPENWKISKRKLFSYKDMLAPKILKAWEMESHHEWDENEEVIQVDMHPVLSETLEPKDKVREWLGSNVYSSTPIATQEIGSQDSEDTRLENCSFLSPIMERNIPQKRKLNVQSKTPQNKKRFVDGF